MNYDYAGRPNRYTYAVSMPAPTEKTGGRIVKYDRVTGARTDRKLDSGWVPGEQAFVPAAAARGEDEGWLLSICPPNGRRCGVSRPRRDLRRWTTGGSGRAPRRVPAGFHGAWIADALS